MVLAFVSARNPKKAVKMLAYCQNVRVEMGRPTKYVGERNFVGNAREELL